MTQKFKKHRPRPSARQVGQEKAERMLADAGWKRVPKKGVATGRTGRGGTCLYCENRRHGLPKAFGTRMYPVVWESPRTGRLLCWKHAVTSLMFKRCDDRYPGYKSSNQKLVESVGGSRENRS